MTNDDNPTSTPAAGGRGGWGRRGVLQAAGASALGAGLATLGGGTAFADGRGNGNGKGHGAAHSSDGVVRQKLRFPANGRFRIVQFNDTQDSHRTDTRTIELQKAVLDEVRPNFVVINGDVINGGPASVAETKQAINNVVLPMEERGIPWALTFGNHDEDSTGRTGFDEADMIAFIRQYKHNLNTPGAEVTGTSNQVLTVSAAKGDEDAFAIWLLDSGRYAPKTIAGQDIEGYPHWDWLRFDQVEWYARTSRELEERRGSALPGLVFQHIALHEHRAMWFDSIDSRTEADHSRAREKHSIVGERHEDECPGPFNSGMFNAMLHRGDIKGLFVGHDHINSYTGDYFGIELGYSPGTGFAPYGLPGADKHRLRGARVFTLEEGADGFTSELKFARDYGIDMSPTAKPGEPAPFPDYVK
ncbi:metallophosphoesterase family protein [Brevibacterium sp.]|uniref:metallophosphoesterase family protein n=1 Tax=Brevibacterium sp. TaxID=1701 RepID=UPI0028112626|nr:metallophosphoesterase family protein [Brevibacterium sp.]